MKLEQISVSTVGLLSGREKKKREIGMARKRAENREGSLGFPGLNIFYRLRDEWCTRVGAVGWIPVVLPESILAFSIPIK
ncbi:hypothetical protein TNCV_1966221 [Trichonephila clavipes]|nr:hypothetical protein TNCV_1966221 [Trichonephila clavipes]